MRQIAVLLVVLLLVPALHAGAAPAPSAPTPWWAQDSAGGAGAPGPVPAYSEDQKAYLAKTPPEAFFRSVVLPGWGQRYGERPGRAAFFTAVEAGLWTGLILSRESWKSGESRYMAFAKEHAGVTGSRDHDYYVNIGNYNNLDEYNAAKRQQRAYEEQYRSSNLWWEWDSSTNRSTFKDIRIGADRDRNRIYYMIGGLVLNRIVSAIDAGRGLAKKQNELKQKGTVELGYDPTVGGPSLVWRGNLGR